MGGSIPLDDDTLHAILSFLDARDLSFLSVVSKEIRDCRSLQLAWTSLCDKIPGVTFAGPVVVKDGLVASKCRAILAYRAERFAASCESQCCSKASLKRKLHQSQRVCPSCGILPEIEMDVFSCPDRYTFYARISSILPLQQQQSKDVWQGFLPPPQREWGSNMGFDLKRLDGDMPSMSRGSCKEGLDGRLAWRKPTVTVVAFRKDDPMAAPSLVMCSSRIHAVATDVPTKQICYQLRKRHCAKSGSTDEDVWVSARIFCRPDDVFEFSSIHIKVSDAPQAP